MLSSRALEPRLREVVVGLTNNRRHFGLLEHILVLTCDLDGISEKRGAGYGDDAVGYCWVRRAYRHACAGIRVIVLAEFVALDDRRGVEREHKARITLDLQHVACAMVPVRIEAALRHTHRAVSDGVGLAYWYAVTVLAVVRVAFLTRHLLSADRLIPRVALERHSVSLQHVA
jgi:hypothetical protein